MHHFLILIHLFMFWCCQPYIQLPHLGGQHHLSFSTAFVNFSMWYSVVVVDFKLFLLHHVTSIHHFSSYLPYSVVVVDFKHLSSYLQSYQPWPYHGPSQLLSCWGAAEFCSLPVRCFALLLRTSLGFHSITSSSLRSLLMPSCVPSEIVPQW